MAKLSRVIMKVFGEDAGANQFGKIGSLAAGTPETTTDLSQMQSLSNFLGGWFSCVVGNNSPAIEDMNALHYLMAYQLAYGFQQGIAEWEVSTEYHLGSMVNDSGIIYVSLANDNLGNALSDSTKWRTLLNYVIPVNPSTDSPFAVTAIRNGAILSVDTVAALQVDLPAPLKGLSFSVVDKTGNADSFPITINRNATEKIQGLASDFVCEAPFGSWTFVCDGTDWFIK